MKLKRDRQPAKVALIIFSTLVVFCIGQLSWWIIFQINTAQERRQFSLESLGCRSALIATVVNRDFNRLSNAARAILVEKTEVSARLIAAFDNLLTDPAVSGYCFASATGTDGITGGIIDSTFYVSLGTGVVVYFDPAYPMSLIGEDSARMVFAARGHNDGSTSGWVKPSMFIASPAWRAELDEQARRTIVMFSAEGGFFFLVILFGAFMIYRTLYRAEELKFRQQNFIHSVTHELKAPLASIRLYLETIMAGKVEEAKTKELFPKMIEDCDRLEGLMDNVLEVGHFGKTGYKLKLARTNLSDDLNEYLDDLESLARRYGGSIRREIKKDVIVKSDYQSLRRMVNALVDNAFKYSPSGQRDVAVSLESGGSFCRIHVCDSGVGIESGEQNRVFERFYRGNEENSRSAKGTGLGLFLVREIVEAHGGKVMVRSPGTGQGAEFIVRLPLAKS